MAPVALVASSFTLHHSSSLDFTNYRRPNSSHVSFYPQIPAVPFSSKSHLAILRYRPLNYMTKTSTLLPNKPNSDVHLQILKNIQSGNLKESVMIITSSGFKTGICSNTYCSILQLCAEQMSLVDGKKIHSVICSSGTEIDTVLGSKLVFMYIKCGERLEARKIFAKISHKANTYYWNLLIREYVKAADYRECLLLFKEMHRLDISPDPVTFTCIFKCFASLGSVKEGEMVHAYVIKLGFSSYNTVGNALLLFYSKVKRIGLAINLFDEMPNKDVISWNTLISGCVSNGLANKAIKMLIDMYEGGVSMDLASVVGVIPACAKLGHLSIGKTIHGYSIKNGFSSEVSLCNSLIDMYSKCSYVDSSIQIFERMTQKSIVSYTSMISAYSRAELFDQALDLFTEIESKGIRPDTFVITCVLHACACKGSIDRGRLIHKYVVQNGMDNNLFVSNALMDMYAKCGNMEEARSIFDSASNKDIISWNTLIGGYLKNGLPNKALNLFGKMSRRIKPNAMTMSCILPAVASLSCLEKGKEMHGYILRAGYMNDQYVSNPLIDMYIKCGAILLARILFGKIYEKDLHTYTVMLAGYCMHGHGAQAISLFKQMRKKKIKPNEVSFVSILHACSHSGLIHEGWMFFDTMRNEYKIEPKLEHYTCMVDLLSRAGRLKKAYDFIESMPIEPDLTIWSVLLSGCRIYRDVKLAEKIAEKVFEIEPENTGFYVLLANIYTEAEKWEEVKRLREKVGRRGLNNKKTGCSWIQVNGKVNVFVSGDKSLPQAKKINEFLEHVMRRMKTEENYLPNKRYALLGNEEDREKDEALCGHNERLAIAFGVLNCSNGGSICVSKDTRVCGDCHEVAKFVTKMVGIEIILRDMSRFHRFEGGRCSCRGCW